MTKRNSKYDIDMETLKKTIPDKILEHRGFISFVCRDIGIHRSTFYKWKKLDPEFARVCDEAASDANEENGDKAEMNLFNAIDEGDTTATIFYLKTKHRHRGYVERRELVGADGKPIETRESRTISSIDRRLSELLESRKERDSSTSLPN